VSSRYPGEPSKRARKADLEVIINYMLMKTCTLNRYRQEEDKEGEGSEPNSQLTFRNTHSSLREASVLPYPTPHVATSSYFYLTEGSLFCCLHADPFLVRIQPY